MSYSPFISPLASSRFLQECSKVKVAASSEQIHQIFRRPPCVRILGRSCSPDDFLCFVFPPENSPALTVTLNHQPQRFNTLEGHRPCHFHEAFDYQVIGFNSRCQTQCLQELTDRPLVVELSRGKPPAKFFHLVDSP